MLTESRRMLTLTAFAAALFAAATAFGANPRDAVVKVTGTNGSASAIRIRGDGLAVTAEHVVKQIHGLHVVYTPSQDGLDSAALIKVEPGQFALVANEAPRVGDCCEAFGFPRGEWSEAGGLVAAVQQTSAAAGVSTNINIAGGFSGGGLFNCNGELIGVASATSHPGGIWIGVPSILKAIEHLPPTEPIPDPGPTEIAQADPRPYNRGQQAQAERKKYLVVFTLSRNCPSCTRMKADLDAGRIRNPRTGRDIRDEYEVVVLDLLDPAHRAYFDEYVAEVKKARGVVETEADGVLRVPLWAREGEARMHYGYRQPITLAQAVWGTIRTVWELPADLVEGLLPFVEVPKDGDNMGSTLPEAELSQPYAGAAGTIPADVAGTPLPDPDAPRLDGGGESTGEDGAHEFGKLVTHGALAAALVGAGVLAARRKEGEGEA